MSDMPDMSDMSDMSDVSDELEPLATERGTWELGVQLWLLSLSLYRQSLGPESLPAPAP